jgi:hypothetical protein
MNDMRMSAYEKYVFQFLSSSTMQYSDASLQQEVVRDYQDARFVPSDRETI